MVFHYMSENQLHGKKYEKYIMNAFPKALSKELPITSHWDILSEYDEELFIPTSIKTTKNNIIWLSDARNFISNHESFRLIVAQYNQKNGYKEFYNLLEFIITPEILDKIIGDLKIDFVKEFHESINKFGYGKENQILARDISKKFKELNKETKTLITLNPKIDSKRQRRLQCSIKISDLIKVIQPNVFNNFYKGVNIKVNIEGSPRKFKKTSQFTNEIININI